MKKLFLILMTLTLLCAVTAQAASVDITAMTDDELTALQENISHELQRRQNEADRANAVPEGSVIYQNDGSGAPKIIFPSEEMLRSRISRVELTPENWRDYMGDYYYPYIRTSYNNFGEITDSIESRIVGFGLREGYIGRFKDVGMKFTGKSTYKMKGEWSQSGETDVYSFVADVWTESSEPFSFDLYKDPLRDVHLEAYECTAAVGSLYLLEVEPEITQWMSSPNVTHITILVGEQWYGESGYLDVLYDRLYPQE